MWPESGEKPSKLKTGLTTGSCATACCVAAAQYLLENNKPSVVSIMLPKGKIVELSIEDCNVQGNAVRTSTIKDAGDDPDVTHGAVIFVLLKLETTPGVIFKAAEGVGTVTKKGLLLDVGEPAINPVPRQMMTEHLNKLANDNGYTGGFSVAVGVENGAAIAQKTMNPRLGILGGLSILGTTGIVRPYSCSAWIASIHQGIDVAKANGIKHIAATTGNSSEMAIKSHYGLTDIALIEMGDFAGAVLKHLKKSPIEKLTLCGGFGKVTKLANGHLDLNSRVSAIDFDHLASLAQQLGASLTLQADIKQANTSIEVLNLCEGHGLNLAKKVCEEALIKASRILPSTVKLEVWAINRKGEFVANAGVVE